MATPAREEEEVDSLSSLEQRITRAVELVTELRRQNQQMAEQLKSAASDRDQAKLQAQKSVAELEELRAERKQVRTRIEKLLGQMDLLGSAS